MGELDGQQLRPMHSSPAGAGRGWMVSPTAVPMTVAVRIANTKIETAIVLMAKFSGLVAYYRHRPSP
jgi:hypothetical protein